MPAGALCCGRRRHLAVLDRQDAVGRIQRTRRHETALLIDVAAGADVLVVPHGSIAVDGVSLTINAIPEAGAFQVAIIEYTEHQTTLGELAAGDEVNVEGDVIGKYVQALLESRLRRPASIVQSPDVP